MDKFSLAEETLGYQTSPDPSNSDKRLLIAPSRNVLVDYQKKVRIRPGYMRLGAANPALTECRNGWTWNTSTGTELAQRFYDDELEVYLTTVDTIAINAWTRIAQSWSTTEKLRPATWFDATENIDLQVMVQGDANIYEYNGAVAVVDSIPDGTHVKKAGTTTWAQNRFYTTRNKSMVCVRTGTVYTYASGETSDTLVVTDSTGLIAGDILVQSIVTQSNKPVANHANDVIYSFENQICIGSDGDEEVWISKNTSYYDFAYSSPRLSGEGALLTLDDPTRGIASLGSLLLIFAGRSSIFQAQYEQISVGSTLAETLKVKKLDVGVDQGALNQECIVPIGNSLAYLSNEIAVRIIDNPDNLTGINPRTYSNPIKPDFDAEDWDGAFGAWYKNILFFTAPEASHTYMLNFVEDADGKLFRFWNPPQVLPIGPTSIFDAGDGPLLYGHSNSVPETYELFIGQSDGQYEDMDVADKLPIDANATFAYDYFKNRAALKNFDEYYSEGEITQNTIDLLLTLNYDYQGSTQIIEKTIDGSDEDLLEGLVGFNSLAQQSLGVNPLGGLLNPPSDAHKFRVVFEIAKEDFHQLGRSYSTNDVDRYWAILADGSNATLSTRRDTSIRK